ncbi:hypothetical protein [Paenibacillus sinopodophylli]|uniref:hypothetical protein n=1 Tax=Paenibacillus sinopodophylli TaxID=1837342 RepID=UPI00110CB599|nr:hypothetical protein [Paenibacillus sinopodophylli]
MNKRGTEQFIDKYIKLAVENYVKGLFTADKAEGHLDILSQLALTAIHDKQRHYRIGEIQKAIRAGDVAQAKQLTARNWRSTAAVDEDNFKRIY